ncbi:MAG TPA: hypothetical protein VD947_03880 [Patescibacteria group bacterium]|nr:hypothetical protein [Patescibacteria group bacterium]
MAYRKSLQLIIVLAVIITGVSVYFTTTYLAKNYLKTNTNKDEMIPAIHCPEKKTVHTIYIKNDNMQPENINGNLCDTLTVKNSDDKLRRMAFGVHERHHEYDGITEKILRKDQSFTVTLNQVGTYTIHDHLEEETEAEFTVRD